jgi:thioesterase domain-containing protein
VGIDDSLADLRVTPEQRGQILSRVERSLGRAVPMEHWDPPGTVSSLAAVLVRLGVPVEAGAPIPPATPARPRPRVFVRHADGTRPPLIFLHGDFNGAGFYCLNLAAELGPSQPFYALGPHGLHGVPIPATIEEMADDQLPALRAIQPSGPYRLGGHCNGGLVAFEMARRLEAQGEEVALLVMIATDVRSAAGPPERSWSHVMRYYWDRLRPRRDVAPSPPEPSALESPGLRAVAERQRAQDERFAIYARALDSYVPGPFGGRAVLLWPEGEEKRHGGDRTQGWGRVTTRLAVESIPGKHLSCVTTHVRELATALRRALDHA